MKHLIDLKETVDTLNKIDEFLRLKISYNESEEETEELKGYKSFLENLKDYFTHAMKSNTHLSYLKEDDADHFAKVGKMINGAEIAKEGYVISSLENFATEELRYLKSADTFDSAHDDAFNIFVENPDVKNPLVISKEGKFVEILTHWETEEDAYAFAKRHGISNSYVGIYDSNYQDLTYYDNIKR